MIPDLLVLATQSYNYTFLHTAILTCPIPLETDSDKVDFSEEATHGLLEKIDICSQPPPPAMPELL